MALAADFANHFRKDQLAWKVCRHWVMPEQVPDILLSYKSKDDADVEPLMELLMLRPRIADSHIEDLQEVASRDFGPATVRVLTSKYPEQLEPACIRALESDPLQYKAVMAAAKLLGDYGTTKSIDALQQVTTKKVGSKRGKKRVEKEVEIAIEKIKSRGTGDK